MYLPKAKLFPVTFLLMAMIHVPLFAQDVPTNQGGNEEGFKSIFDGKTLKGWKGDQVYWRVENGVIVGEITPKTILKNNTFLIWQDGEPENFELKLDCRISVNGNSGINYRSKAVSEISLALQGYQADIDGKNQWSGQNYEERGRAFLALRGQIARVDYNGKPQIIGSTGDKEGLTDFIKSDDWNEYHLIVRDNIMIHMINGHVMSIVIDDDQNNRAMKGLIGVQVHVGPPMKVEYRNIRLKEF
ncbi:DUF1080 domain-containing protein [Fulvivirgaceae bacterium BMA10]|uniref:DUF1080 domain-containing protein n=1 Tax=Splendidivirga corallicola TaxID=3051826 RepID=A0ABT8KJA6_9BACT|nr:DUF1080 domain-containing protein [Fulvivirgaceae bacterium BMA10]